MEPCLTIVQALPEHQVFPAARVLLSAVDQNAKTIAVLRGALLSLLALSGESNISACKAALNGLHLDVGSSEDGSSEWASPQPHGDVDCSEFLPSNLFEQPWLSAVADFRLPAACRENEQIQVPVMALRFTHNTIDSRLHFRNQHSMFKTFDELQREVLAPDELAEPLDICLHEGKLYSMSNRRLFVLLMYQAVHRNRVVSAPCILRRTSWNSGKFWKALTTDNDGLAIDAYKTVGLQQALHLRRPLFDSGSSAMSLLVELLTGSQYEWLLNHVRLRDSLHQADGHSLTLTDSVCPNSYRKHDRKQSEEDREDNIGEDGDEIECGEEAEEDEEDEIEEEGEERQTVEGGEDEADRETLVLRLVYSNGEPSSVLGEIQVRAEGKVELFTRNEVVTSDFMTVIGLVDGGAVVAAFAREGDIERTASHYLEAIRPENMQDIVEGLAQINLETLTELERVASSIFQRVMLEPHNAGAYADISFQLSTRYPVFPSACGKNSLKKLLLDMCQCEFEKHFCSSEADQQIDENELFALSLKKCRMLANIRFIGHLFLTDMVALKTTGAIIHDLIGMDSEASPPDEYHVECLCVFLRIIGSRLDSCTIGESLLSQALDILSSLRRTAGLSRRVKSMISGLLADLRQHAWQQ
eukprot:TRINITY_DN57660_c0_g1_i1.p1 TRINITY_DN57660_c0_g1~~TRINITY_DN57660_c0_g1_i1.p1  ORF type:complete len:642 (-),score=77.46 TRINITY_DN57660_c0_g1_i1:117-2042(-)